MRSPFQDTCLHINWVEGTKSDLVRFGLENKCLRVHKQIQNLSFCWWQKVSTNDASVSWYSQESQANPTYVSPHIELEPKQQSGMIRVARHWTNQISHCNCTLSSSQFSLHKICTIHWWLHTITKLRRCDVQARKLPPIKRERQTTESYLRTSLQATPPYDAVRDAVLLEMNVNWAEIYQYHDRPFQSAVHLDSACASMNSINSCEKYKDPKDLTIGRKTDRFDDDSQQISKTIFKRGFPPQALFQDSLYTSGWM